MSDDRSLQRLADPISLATIFGDVRRRSQAAGVDGVTPDAYSDGLHQRLERLSAAILSGAFAPSRLMRVRRKKPGGGVRRLSIPVVEDRIVLELLRHALSAVVEPLLTRAAFAYRPGRSARAAVDTITQHIDEGATWAALADIREFFDSVRISDVMNAARAACSDLPLLRLLQRVLEGHALRPGVGLAQGSSLSPLLSNLVLSSLDRGMLADGYDFIRYCDNLCVTAESRARAERALTRMRREVEKLDLALKQAQSRVVDVREGFVWLGFWLGPGGGRVSQGAVNALGARLEAAGAGLDGDSLRTRLLPIVRGWMQYFDAPLPDGAVLGAHDAVARALINDLGKRPAGSAASESPDPVMVRESDAADEEGDAWDESGGQGDPPPRDVEEVERLLSEADRLAAAGGYEQAEAAFDAAQLIARAPAPAPTIVDSEPLMTWDDEAIDAFIGLFAAGNDSFEVAPRKPGGRREFATERRPLGPTDIKSHFLGKQTVAIWPRRADGTCTLGVIDIDGRSSPASAAVLAYAAALVGVAKAWEWAVLVEVTGGRGAHLWVPAATRMRAEQMANALDALLREAGTPADGVLVERLPGPDSALDLHAQSMTLPLGLHVETGVQSSLQWGTGVEVAADLSGLFDGEANETLRVPESPSTPSNPPVYAAPIEPSPELPSEFGRGVARVMKGCILLRRLAEKATVVGHLDHAERLSVLYTLGHLGKQGEKAIHGIIGRCQNYDAAETARQMGRMTGLPIGCARMREKHATPDVLPQCCCEFEGVRRRGGYPTPVLHAIGFKRAWRDALLSRRDAEARARVDGTQGVVAMPEEVPTGVTREASDASGALVKGAPPHEWA